MASTTGEVPTSLITAESSSSVAMEAKLMLATGHADCQKLKDLLNQQNAATVVAVMSSGSREQPPSSAAGGNASAVAMDAKLMVTTSHVECQKLKDLLNQKDATTIAVAIVSSNHDSPASMDPRLLAAASKGDLEELQLLLNRSSNCIMQLHTADIERGTNVHEPHTPLLLKGVTAVGDTALHVVATNGDGQNFLDCASCMKDLLFAKNKKGDTPIHCAARAGNFSMVKHLISLIGRGGKTVKDLLRMENHSKETVLHHAIRAANNDISIVKKLLEIDQELACFPTEGTSPIYLAIQLDKAKAAEAIYTESKGALSYCGPNGQNALHAAVFRSRVLTEKLLEWKKDLAEDTDKNGSTPLHFATALPRQWSHSALLRWWWRREIVCPQVFDANKNALYQSDRDGFYPIHVAASAGEKRAVAKFIKECPSSAGLRDAKGRTFLHVAVEKKKVFVVRYSCRNLGWILNMQDNGGNTALHLAVQAGSLAMLCALLGERKVDMNLTNAEGQTPLDIAEYKIPTGLSYVQNPENHILRALRFAGAKTGLSRSDRFSENSEEINKAKPNLEIKEMGQIKDATQILSIGSALIATVTFGASFAMPGGYIADDHIHGGAPTLAGRYSFDAFMMANTLAFICSSIATVGFMYSGAPMVNRVSRKAYLGISIYFMYTSITALAAAFALGMYLVLAPVARKTAIAICIMSPVVALWTGAEFVWKLLLLLPLYSARMGRFVAIATCATQMVVYFFIQGWPLLFIFLWAAYGRTHPILKVDQPAQTPSPTA